MLASLPEPDPEPRRLHDFAPAEYFRTNLFREVVELRGANLSAYLREQSLQVPNLAQSSLSPNRELIQITEDLETFFSDLDIFAKYVMLGEANSLSAILTSSMPLGNLKEDLAIDAFVYALAQFDSLRMRSIISPAEQEERTKTLDLAALLILNIISENFELYDAQKIARPVGERLRDTLIQHAQDYPKTRDLLRPYFIVNPIDLVKEHSSEINRHIKYALADVAESQQNFADINNDPWLIQLDQHLKCQAALSADDPLAPAIRFIINNKTAVIRASPYGLFYVPEFGKLASDLFLKLKVNDFHTIEFSPSFFSLLDFTDLLRRGFSKSKATVEILSEVVCDYFTNHKPGSLERLGPRCGLGRDDCSRLEKGIAVIDGARRMGFALKFSADPSLPENLEPGTLYLQSFNPFQGSSAGHAEIPTQHLAASVVLSVSGETLPGLDARKSDFLDALFFISDHQMIEETKNALVRSIDIFSAFTSCRESFMSPDLFGNLNKYIPKEYQQVLDFYACGCGGSPEFKSFVSGFLAPANLCLRLKTKHGPDDDGEDEAPTDSLSPEDSRRLLPSGR